MKALAIAFALLTAGCATANPAPEERKAEILNAPIRCTDDGKVCAVVIELPDKTILIPIPMMDLCIWRPA